MFSVIFRSLFAFLIMTFSNSLFLLDVHLPGKEEFGQSKYWLYGGSQFMGRNADKLVLHPVVVLEPFCTIGLAPDTSLFVPTGFQILKHRTKLLTCC